VEYHVSILDEPLTIGEDFSGYTREYPGVFAFIGSNSKYDLHHPKYHPDVRILEKAPQYFVQLVQRLLTWIFKLEWFHISYNFLWLNVHDNWVYNKH